MRYSFISAAILALVSSVVAQTPGFDAITSPTQDQNIPAGSSFDIIWQPGTVTGTITITLLQGATPSTLQPGAVIASSIDNTLGKYTWSVPSSSSFATYGFEIVLDSTAKSSSPTLQYSFPFHITGGTSSSATGSGSSSLTGTPSTTTISLSTGPSYTSSSPVVTSTPTSSISSSNVTVVSTSSNSTTSATLKPTTSSNVTLSTLKTTSTKASATSGSNSTSTARPTASSNAAVSNIATGSLAVIGGIVLAFAL